MSVLGFWRGGIGIVQVTGQVDALANQEQQRHAQAAEDLEVDPVALEGERDEQVGGAAEQEETDPGDVEPGPDDVRQVQGVAHDALDQQAIADDELGRASCRESVCKYVSISGVAGQLK